MKRSGPIKRNAPLKAKTPLSPGLSELKRKTPLKPKKDSARVEVDKLLARLDEGYEKAKKKAAKRPKVTPEERKARKTTRVRSGGICEIGLPGICTQWATDMHHRQNRSQGGEWSVPNMLHGCHPCHMHVTVQPELARERGWSVSGYQDPAKVPVWVNGRGRVFLTADGGVEPLGEVA